MTSSRCSALVTSGSLLFASFAFAAPNGPPYFDPGRGIQRQTDAANVAKKEVKGGDVKKVVEHLGSVSAYVRDAVFLEVAKNWSDDQLEKLGNNLFHPDPFVSGQIAELFGRRKLAAGREQLEAALKKQKHPEALTEICWALGEIADASSVKSLLRLAKHKAFMVAGEAYQAAARCDKASAVETLRGGLNARTAGVRIACLAGLAEANAKAGIEAALEQLDVKKQERGWETRVLVQILENFRDVDKRKPHADLYTQAMDKLIARLEDEDGRAKHELGKTLRSLTGEWSMGDEHAAWESWWQVKKSGWEPIDRDPEKSGDEAGGGGGTRARYFGIPIYSKRVVFVLDLSGGMDRPIGGDGTDSPQRILVAKEELKQTLQTLEKDVMTNVIFFASAFYSCAPQLLPVKKAIRKIIAYVEEQQIPTKPHTNRGNLFDPIIEAALQPEVDTIFLVTEGNPTEGRYIDRDRFVRNMMRTLKYTKTEVNALFIGSARSAEKYLDDVSKPTGGRYYNVKKMKGY